MPFVQPFQGSYRVVWAPFSFCGDKRKSSYGLLGVVWGSGLARRGEGHSVEDGGNEWFGVGGFSRVYICCIPDFCVIVFQ